MDAPQAATTLIFQWLRPLPVYGVILCTQHRTCYTPGSNLRAHLFRKHAVKGQRAKEVEEWVTAQNIAAEVTFPPDESPFIHGLQFYEGWVCTVESCTDRSRSKERLQRHCSKVHGIDIRRRQAERSMYRKVVLQCFFAKATHYWIVQPETPHPQEQPAPSESGDRVEGASSIRGSRPRGHLLSHRVAHALTASLAYAVRADEDRYRQLGEPNHVSEISPWLRISGFHYHLAGLDCELVATSHLTPKSDEDDPRLYELIWSVERVLRQAYDLVRDLLPVDARVLNTF